ncbi:MAG: hypothetical protein IJ313_00630 [Clostridia bacterium]|nr:hypothetical protein [Clostridia bacterium]
MDQKDIAREEQLLSICEAVDGQSEGQQAEDNVLLSGLRLAYNRGYVDGVAASA